MQLPENKPAPNYVGVVIVAVAIICVAAWFLSPTGSESSKPASTTNTVATSFPSVKAGEAESEEVKKGSELAHQICASCHMFPEPHMLDKITWGMEVLPDMAKWIGLLDVPLDQLNLEPRVRKANIIPSTPAINLEQWRQICTYYLATAPVDAEPQAPRLSLDAEMKQFEVMPVYYKEASRVTMVKIDETNHNIVVGEAKPNKLRVLNAEGKRLASMTVDSPPVDMTVKPEGLYLTLIGSYLPSDALEGKLVRVGKFGSTNTGIATIIGDLPRPTTTIFTDLNQDGKEDMLICGYGNILGEFAWYENMGDGNYTKHVLMDRCGSIKAWVYDFNKDGLPDIAVMMAQAREGIYLFMNKGHGEFEQVTVVERPPLWGNSYFELVDFNHDGWMDILATNGDNGDHVDHLPPFKNYHGIRLYLNDGKNNFKEAWFFPMNGAYKAMARDFNKDGNMDIVAISFYPDYRKSPRESFVYFENQGGPGINFKAYSFKECFEGRWLTMDVGDLYGTGNLDIVLGAFKDGPTFVPHLLQDRWLKDGPSVMILRNVGQQKKASAP